MAWVGLIFVLATVYIWGAVAVIVMAYIGAGAWFYTGDAGEAPEAPRAAAAPGRPPPGGAAGGRRRADLRRAAAPGAAARGRRRPRRAPPRQPATGQASRMMIETFRKLRDLLMPRERRGLYLLLGILMVGGLFETFGVASVLPFMAVLSQPERIETTPKLAAIYDALGFTSPHHFLIFLGVGSFLFVLMGVFTHILSLYAIARFSNMRSYTLSSRLLRGYLHQPYSWFLNRHSAELGKTILNEVDSVVTQTMMPALKLISNVVICLFVVTLLVFLQPWVALGTAAVLGSCYAAILARRPQVPRPIRPAALRGHPAALPHRRRGDRRHQGREAPRARGRLPRPLPDPLAARTPAPTPTSTVVGESPRYLLQAVAFGGMLADDPGPALHRRGSLAGVLPLLAVYAFAGIRLFPAMQRIYTELTMIRFNRMTLDPLHADMAEIGAAQDERCRPRRCRWSRCT